MLKKQGVESKWYDFGYDLKSVLCRMEEKKSMEYFFDCYKNKHFFCGTPCIVLLVNGMA